MAGSPIWGAGHHQGFIEGREQGHVEGGAVVAVATAVATTLYLGGKWGYSKLRSRQQAKLDLTTSTQHVDTTPCESEHDPISSECQEPPSSEDKNPDT